jgi:DNA-binding FrmR family transcriptional regulator
MSPNRTQGASAPKRVIQPHKKALLARMKRIEGQARGVTKMLEEDRYCVEILNQIAALRSALDGVALRLFEDHTKGCLTHAICHGDTAAVDELVAVVRQFRR